MSNEELQAWVEHISLTSFQLPFRHRAVFNSRLSTTGGRYFMKSHDIEINPHQLVEHGPDEVERIIKHELCHYHLHLSGKGYRHQDADFKALLQAVGGSRYCKAIPRADSNKKKALPYRYLLRCKECHMEYKRKRRMDPARYRCGRCQGPLQLLTLDSGKE
ncbi:SprT family protein [Paenibacillus sp. F411]|uniref:SprT family protein n=1 Tax=Paenibacillus sp. F411 TaxID=2820239 RepID=UPI001AAFCAD3|nr:SprT family protein [Paenibacillus sp. F411]MBO2943730.1 SprT family protein [Paenibacillus sp. F411]